ncbi:precorrin-6A reductase [Rhizobium sp. RU20A]|uniref:cobalt-precorrin-6A reductase n=1 Tax=Rhizobium sp. RU20A TaxID=1907412 RepID=UPI00095482F2|nr:cobalt-precorrin-6A reductase [Rhizobium sp. RU20A]SIQ98965.1 precorrin-6A reductase [Rhizobium sp. RU20A]
MGAHRILILGGTTEARRLAERLAGLPDIEATISLAGRTAEPRPLPLPTRIGGFGGAEGLARYLKDEAIDLLIDATHPFAARMSINAAEASVGTGTPVFALRRTAWQPVAGDRWTSVTEIDAAVRALGETPRRVFLAIGRQEAHRFAAAPQHHYLIRSVDPVDPPLSVPSANYILSAGPFTLEAETALFAGHAIDVIVTKNSGGEATAAKLAAARVLGIDVIMVERRLPPQVPTVETVEAALAAIAHRFGVPDVGSIKRGV